METLRQWIWTWLGIPDGEFVRSEDFLDLQDKFQEIQSKLDKLLIGLENKASAASVFDRDKIPLSESTRYVPIARRRAAAERQSLGPVTHDDKVRANNAQAMEN